MSVCHQLFYELYQTMQGSLNVMEWMQVVRNALCGSMLFPAYNCAWIARMPKHFLGWRGFHAIICAQSITFEMWIPWINDHSFTSVVALFTSYRWVNQMITFLCEVTTLCTAGVEKKIKWKSRFFLQECDFYSTMISFCSQLTVVTLRVRHGCNVVVSR